jgi:drug/metabolite transporter (DMT)-like permease
MRSIPSSQPTSHYFPALSCMIAAVLWGFFWYPLRLLEDMGVQGLWSTLIIYCSALVFILPACCRWRDEFLKHKTDYMLIMIFAGWANLAFILAVLDGQIVRVLLLFYLSPIWAIILAFLILREHLTKTALVALVLAILGAVLMLWDSELIDPNTMNRADFYAITSGMAFAVTNVMVRKIGDVPIGMKMGSAWLGVITLTICGLFIAQPHLPDITIQSGALAFFIGFPMMYILTWTAQYGVTFLPVQRSSVIFLLEIVAGAVSAAYLTNEIVTNVEYIGGTLIIFAGLISVIKEKNEDISAYNSSAT